MYRAHDSLLDVARAVKVLAPEHSAIRRQRTRFLQEARAMARIAHPNVVSVYDIGSEQGRDYLVMELAEGGAVGRQPLPLPLDVVGTWIAEVLAALNAAHSAGLVHRDVKPSNVLLSRGVAKLCDFGIAVAWAGAGARVATQAGTASFMAPEQRDQQGRVGPRADLYGVATTAFALLTRRSPAELWRESRTGGRMEQLPLEVREVVYRATRRSPEGRYRTAREMALAWLAAVRLPEARASALLGGFHATAPEALQNAEITYTDADASPDGDPPDGLEAPELVEGYRRRLAQRVPWLQEEWAAGLPRPAELRRLGHKLAGSGATYGLPAITERARAVEHASDTGLRNAVLRLLLRVRAEAASHLRTRCLLVTAESRLAELCEAAAEIRGWTLTAAGSLAAARAALETAWPTLIVLDLVLPDGDGRDLLAELAAAAGEELPPVIVVTYPWAGQLRSECQARGAAALLDKPVTREGLLAAVDAVLGATGSGRDDVARAYRRARAAHEADGTPFSFALLQPHVRPAPIDALAAALRADATLAPWHDGELVCVLPGLDSAAAELELNVALGVVPACAGRVGVVGAGSAGLDDALSLARRLMGLGDEESESRQVVAVPWDEPVQQRIAVVDDDPDVRTAVRHALEGPGRDIVPIETGDAFLAALPDLDAEVVVLDVELPGRNGFEVLELLKASGARVGVLMLTSLGADAHVERAFELGADDYVVKPFQPRQLAARVQRLLRRVP